MRSQREREASVTLDGLRSLHRVDPEGRWRSILAGIITSYRWCRETMVAAYRGGTDAAFHEWRLAVRDHALQVRALAALWPAALGGRLEVLERLAELQRQDRDLFLRHGERPEMLDLINQRHEALRALARPLGRRLFGAPAATFRRCLQACWQSWRARQEALRRPARDQPKVTAVAAAPAVA
jgi:hypothetical protein